MYIRGSDEVEFRHKNFGTPARLGDRILPIQWYFRKDGQEHGPVTSDDLRRLAARGILQPTDAVRKAEMTRWASASALKGLFPAAKSLSPISPVVPPILEPASPQPSDPLPTESSSRSKWVVYFAAAAVMFAGAGAVYRYVLHPAETNSVAEPSQPIKPPATEPMLASDTVDPLIIAISSRSPFDRGVALLQVKAATVSPKIRGQVHQIICDTLDDRAFASIWSSAARALGELGSAADLPRLKPLIDSAPMETQCAAMAASMVLDPEAGIKLFEPHAADDQFGSTTAGDLADWGSRCEPVALVMLKSHVQRCRYYALYLLKAFGTANALQAIDRARAAEPDKRITEGYQFTIDAINSRN
jgi:hypothetical protein